MGPDARGDSVSDRMALGRVLGGRGAALVPICGFVTSILPSKLASATVSKLLEWVITALTSLSSSGLLPVLYSLACTLVFILCKAMGLGGGGRTGFALTGAFFGGKLSSRASWLLIGESLSTRPLDRGSELVLLITFLCLGAGTG